MPSPMPIGLVIQMIEHPSAPMSFSLGPMLFPRALRSNALLLGPQQRLNIGWLPL